MERLKKLNKLTAFIFFLVFFTQLSAVKALSYQNFDGKYNYNQYENNQTNANINSGDDEVLFILDASGSMTAKMGYSPKLYHAIDSIRSILNESGNTTKIGLRVFGYNFNNSDNLYGGGVPQSRADLETLCRESSLVLPVAKYNSSNISDRLSQLRARGQSPIGYSLRQAVQNDFSDASLLKHIILITDGGENCGDDPCLYIKKLMTLRNDFVIDVIGITVDDNAYSQLNCIAREGKGKYYSIDNADDFKIKFKQAFNSHTNMSKKSNTNDPVEKIFKKPSGNTGVIYRNYAFQFEN